MRHDPPEYRLIASALTGVAEVPGPEWDWDQTVKLAAREEVLPTLHGRLSGPPEIADFLEAVHQLNAERNRQLLRQVETLALRLNGAGIDPVLLKGAAYLATGVYSDPADRWLQDIDLLVAPPRSAEAFELIRGAGYDPHAPKLTALGRHHHPMLMRTGSVPVEVHHCLGLGACPKLLPAEEVVAGSTAFRLGQSNVRVPSPEHVLTHLIMHSQMQHGSHGRIWPSLRAMYDLVLVGSKFPGAWEPLRRRFRSRSKSRLLDLHLLQTEKVLGMKLPFQASGGGIRWWYRQVLWREPRLRYIDPSYTFSRLFVDKIQVARRLLKDPAGRKFVLTTPFRADFYKRLFRDLADG